jgi:hypothetical protein
MGVAEKCQQKHCPNSHDDEKRGKANGCPEQETFEAVQFPTRGCHKKPIHN